MPARKIPAAKSAKSVKSSKSVKSAKPAPAKDAAALRRNKKLAAAAAALPVDAQVTLKPAKPAKPPKLRRKPVRDSFTMPEADFALIATLKARALAGQRETKKSELLRAGLHALAALDRAALVQALAQLEPVKVGRPKSAH
jgi:hypothetical protein